MKGWDINKIKYGITCGVVDCVCEWLHIPGTTLKGSRCSTLLSIVCPIQGVCYEGVCSASVINKWIMDSADTIFEQALSKAAKCSRLACLFMYVYLGHVLPAFLQN